MITDENGKAYLDHQLQLAADVRLIDDRTWEAPSSVSALAWLRCHLYWPATVAARSTREKGTEVRLRQRALFRGHAVASWHLTPFLFRFEGHELDQRKRAAELAARIVEAEFEALWNADGTQEWPPLAGGSGVATIQHYGIPTALLDWTANPSVAVHFATCSRSSEDSQQAAVLWVQSSDAVELGLKTVLPPPHIERLFRQRGLFTELTPPAQQALEARCSRILFPAQPKLPAQLTYDGTQSIEAELLPVEPWFDALKDWSLVNADDDRFSNVELALLAFTAKHGHHPALVTYRGEFALFLSGELNEPVTQFIRELASRATRTGDCFDPRMLDLLEQYNESYFIWARSRGEAFPRCY